MSGNRRQNKIMRMMKMNEERLKYLFEYADKLRGFQLAEVYLHNEITEVVNEIRKELGLNKPSEDISFKDKKRLSEVYGTINV